MSFSREPGPLTASVAADSDSGESITIRSCALDSGTLTTDTEIIRMSHCGSFYFENRCVSPDRMRKSHFSRSESPRQ